MLSGFELYPRWVPLKNIPFNQGFLISRVQKLLIRSLHLKVSDWDLRKSPPDSATDWNK